MNLPGIFNSMGILLRENQVGEILATNAETAKYGLTLTAEAAKELAEARDHTLQSCGRVELDMQVTAKIISSFCTSSFISQEEYAATIKELQEIFYYMKNETEDEIGDDELIALMKDFFESSCEGSIELLMGRELDEFARAVRYRRAAADTEGEDTGWVLK